MSGQDVTERVARRLFTAKTPDGDPSHDSNHLTPVTTTEQRLHNKDVDDHPHGQVKRHHSLKTVLAIASFVCVLLTAQTLVHSIFSRGVKLGMLREFQSHGTVSIMCDAITWEKRLKDKPTTRRVLHAMAKQGCDDLGVVPSGPRNCSLAIINAGMARSGSTLVNSLILDAVRRLKMRGRFFGPMYVMPIKFVDFDSTIPMCDTISGSCKR